MIQVTITSCVMLALIQTLIKEIQRRILPTIIKSLSQVYYFAFAEAVVGFLTALGRKYKKIFMSIAA